MLRARTIQTTAVISPSMASALMWPREFSMGSPSPRPDDRFDYGEPREISICRIADIAVVVVVHTDRAGVVRIISARRANKKERARHDEEIRKAFDV